MKKVCNKCPENGEQELINFYKKKDTNDGYTSTCKNCHKKYAEENKDTIKERQDKYRKDNSEYFKKYRLKNSDHLKDISKKYSEDNPDYFKKYQELNKDKNEHTASHVLLILDDLIADLNFAKSKTIKQLLVRGRHLFVSIIVTSQYLNSISPLVRSNMDFIAVSQLNAQGLSLLIDNFHMGDISREQFKKLYFKSTTNYGFFLINTSCCQNNDIDEIYGQISTPKQYIK